MPALFPEIEPLKTFYLPVGDGHALYVEELGNPEGQPIVFLHGGPGGGFTEKHRQVFDPAYYRIVLFDQRGSGKSTPHASLDANTTWHLVDDLEHLRTHLDIVQWVVFGGSWGSTLALAYAQTHPNRVKALVLRGIFLCRPEEINWFYEWGGASWLFPQFWQDYAAYIPEKDQNHLVAAYYKRLTSNNIVERLQAAKSWSRWEGATSKLVPDEAVMHSFEADAHALAIARIECHYFYHHCWLEPNQLLNNAGKISHIPTWIVHGQYDVICPFRNAWELYQALPEAHFHCIPDAGHAMSEPGILKILLAALETIKTLN
ncbi:MAG: prolyl aminopeptidase [Cyanobacteria bacterium P01_H01_bin.74]